jgi:hypothetical protein
MPNNNINGRKDQKFLIFDSSTIISLSLSDLLFILEEIKKNSPEIKLIVSKDIINEIVSRPLTIKRFKLEALMVKNLLEKNIIEPATNYVSEEDIEKGTENILNISDRLFRAKNENIQIMHRGEISCIALYKILKAKNEKVLLVVDERTTRMLCENPANLHKLLEIKLHTDVSYDYEAGDFFKGINIIRSSELCSFAFRKKIISLPGSKIESLDAVLYALKFHGCSISSEEIEEEKQIFSKI